jgi:hypothetical protein
MTEPEDQPTATLHSPEPSLGGPTIEAAVENAEAGTAAEGDHAPFGDEETVAPGETRVDQLRDVVPGAVPRGD